MFVLQGEVGDVWSLFLFLLSSLSSSTDLLTFFRLFLVAHFLSFLCTCSRFSWKPLSLSLQHHFLSSSFSLPLTLSLCHFPPVVDVSWCERWSHRERCSSTTLSLFKKPGCPGRGRRNGIECSSDARNANLSGVTDVDHKLLILLTYLLLESFIES